MEIPIPVANSINPTAVNNGSRRASALEWPQNNGKSLLMKSLRILRTERLRALTVSALITLAIAGCDRYIFTINEQPVHTPAVLFTDYQITDEALRGCVEQTILDLKIHHAGELTRLVCTHAQITNLAGLETFVALSELNLTDNDIQSVQPLVVLTNLSAVDLSANPHLDCRGAQTLAGQVGSLKLPPHCVK